MPLLRTQALEGHAKLLKAVNLSADELLAYSDQIQKLAKNKPELTATCDYTASMQVRRLLLVPHRSWQALECRWCDQMTERLAELKKDKTPSATLALACLGYRREGLEQALAILTQVKEAEPPAPLKAVRPKPAPQKAAVPVPPVHTLDEADDDLDPETQAMLADLKKAAEMQAG